MWSVTPVSRQSIANTRPATSLPPIAQQIRSWPDGWFSAPYFSAFVINSCSAIATIWTVLDRSRMPTGPSDVTRASSAAMASISDRTSSSKVTPSSASVLDRSPCTRANASSRWENRE